MKTLKFNLKGLLYQKAMSQSAINLMLS